MDRKENFEKKIGKSLNQMETKLSYLNEGIKGLNEAFKDFQDDMGDYMTFSLDQYQNHEKRIKALEEKLKP